MGLCISSHPTIYELNTSEVDLNCGPPDFNTFIRYCRRCMDVNSSDIFDRNDDLVNVIQDIQRGNYNNILHKNFIIQTYHKIAENKSIVTYLAGMFTTSSVNMNSNTTNINRVHPHGTYFHPSSHNDYIYLLIVYKYSSDLNKAAIIPKIYNFILHSDSFRRLYYFLYFDTPSHICEIITQQVWDKLNPRQHYKILLIINEKLARYTPVTPCVTPYMTESVCSHSSSSSSLSSLLLIPSSKSSLSQSSSQSSLYSSLIPQSPNTSSIIPPNMIINPLTQLFIRCCFVYTYIDINLLFTINQHRKILRIVDSDDLRPYLEAMITVIQRRHFDKYAHIVRQHTFRPEFYIQLLLKNLEYGNRENMSGAISVVQVYYNTTVLSSEADIEDREKLYSRKIIKR